MSAEDEPFGAPFDLDRLTPCEREVWEEFFAGPLGKDDGPTVRVWGFGYACMLECQGVPKVVSEYLAREDPERTIGQYLKNVREARWKREAEEREAQSG